MSLLEILKILMALFNIAFGLYSFFRPEVIAIASNFTLNNERGRAELRILSGGFFVGMGLGALLLGSVLNQEGVDYHNLPYQVVGCAWLGGGAARISNLLMENPAKIADRFYWVLWASELLPGAILIAPH